tara:strand:+ start:261 stop:560 length:300 start_codon:yes stop_codon:yes gene_type:complete
VQLWLCWLLIWIRDTCEILNNSCSGFFIQSFDISFLADFQRCGDVALEEGNPGVFVDFPGELSVLLIWGDKSNDAYLTTERKKFSDFRNSPDIFSTIFS